MITFVEVLTKILMIECVFLLITLAIAGLLVIKNVRKQGGYSVNNLVDLIKHEFSSVFLFESEHRKIYTILIVLYGMLKLTAIWWFTILSSMILSLNLIQIVLVMVIEIAIISIKVHNKLTLDKDKVINFNWVKCKLNNILKKNNKDITVEDIIENIKVKIKKRYNDIANKVS